MVPTQASVTARISRHFASVNGSNDIPIFPVMEADYTNWLKDSHQEIQSWLAYSEFSGKAGSFCILPASHRNPPAYGVLAILSAENLALPKVFGLMARRLHAGCYALHPDHGTPLTPEAAALAWGLGAYRSPLLPKKAHKDEHPCLVTSVPAELSALWLGQDLINTPANLQSPADLLAITDDLAEANTTQKIYVGDALSQNFPLVAAVGQAGRPPGVLDARWRNSSSSDHRLSVTLIGKGVTFDSGGLDIKPRSAMRLMKKDMGGAAHAISAFLILRDLNLPIDLRLIIAATDNGIGPEAFRPGDVLTSRNGTTVEIGDTDAEGRLLLADALSYATEDSPDLIVDFATLTGAARVALGTDLPNMFTSSETWSKRLIKSAQTVADPLWRMPLYRDYQDENHSPIADISNNPASGYGGAITAALFLHHFLPIKQAWIHFDVMAWTRKDQPLARLGGTVQGVRALVSAIRDACRA